MSQLLLLPHGAFGGLTQIQPSLVLKGTGVAVGEHARNPNSMEWGEMARREDLPVVDMLDVTVTTLSLSPSKFPNLTLAMGGTPALLQPGYITFPVPIPLPSALRVKED